MANQRAKPGTAAAIINPSKDAANGGIGSGGSKFKIHMRSFPFEFWTRVEETTGDGDYTGTEGYIVMESNGYVYGRLVLTGLMISAQALGIANLVADNSGISGGIATNKQAIALTVALHGPAGSGREFNINVVVERIRGSVSLTTGLIAVSMVVWVTNTIPSVMEAAN